MKLNKRVFCINDVGWGRDIHGFLIRIPCNGPKYGHICEVVKEGPGGYILKEWPEEKDGWEKECFIELECSSEAEIQKEIMQSCRRAEKERLANK